MSDLSILLSAYIDGQLPADKAKILEQKIEQNAELREEFEQLVAANTIAKSQFDDMLMQPVPLSLAQQIKNTDLSNNEAPSSTSSAFSWRAIAASFVMLGIGAVGGYVAKDYISQQTQVAQKTNWLNTIAGYHSVYAKEKRHLVEVAASESDHIVSWLSNTVGHKFNIPDLSKNDLVFQGARLLAIKGQPIAQLMYTKSNGSVVALCFRLNSSNSSAKAVLNTPLQKNIGAFDFVSWKTLDADFVVIGDKGLKELNDIAINASTQI